METPLEPHANEISSNAPNEAQTQETSNLKFGHIWQNLDHLLQQMEVHDLSLESLTKAYETIKNKH